MKKFFIMLCTNISAYQNDMNNFGSILTPPSSNEDSMPMASPTSDTSLPFNEMGYFDPLMDDHNGIRLEIVEQPVDKFRFRYKSEMSGTHGSLNGINSDRTKKQTYPTVELKNFTGVAYIKCTLYQYNIKANRPVHQPHPHRLVKKFGSEEQNDPHRIRVSSQEGYKAVFHSMGIIHTAKKQIVQELIRKKTILKQEELSQQRKLSLTDEVEIKTESESEANSINLNIVCLRFDAYKDLNGVYQQICCPVYSHPINNLKSALTGELKIVRMDRCVSPAHGNLEVFLLVEKVTKKNIRVHLFELDEDDNPIWDGYGKFSELDVHHQYAIVFRTPPYKDLELQEQKKVFIELERPSDGAKSEPKEFTYVPTHIKTGVKRPRTCYSYSSSGEYSMEQLPLVLPEPALVSTEQVSSEELENIIKKMGAGNEFPEIQVNENFFENMCAYNNSIKDVFSDEYVVTDCISKASGYNDWRSSEKFRERLKRSRNYENKMIMADVPQAIMLFLKTYSGKNLEEFLLDIFTKKINSDGWNILHISVAEANDKNLDFIIEVLKLKPNLYHLYNSQTKDGQTPLHLALDYGNEYAIKLLGSLTDCSVQNALGDTCLHSAVKTGCIEKVQNILSFTQKVKLSINKRNNDGFTPLHIAVKMNQLQLVELLCKNEADINAIELKTGRTVLHLAILDKSLSILEYLLKDEDIDIEKVDYSGKTPFAIAKSTTTASSIKIYNSILEALNSRGLFHARDIKIEEDDDDDNSSIPETENIYIKEEIHQETLCSFYENVHKFKEDPLIEISEILDQSKIYEKLAKILGLDHLLANDVFERGSKSRNLLEYAITRNGDSLWSIRNYLEELKENKAVVILDKMVVEMS